LIFSLRKPVSKIQLPLMYAAQLYRAVLPFVFVPVFLATLGADSYSVIAFYLTLVALLGLLDVGFSSAIIKIFSDSAGNSHKLYDALCLFRQFLLVVLLVVMLIIGLFYLAKDFLAYQWLRQEQTQHQVATAVFMLGVTIAVTYLKQFLLCFFTAIERHTMVALFNIIGPTLCYFGGYLVLTSAADLHHYFYVLAAVSAFETLLLIFMVLHLFRAASIAAGHRNSGSVNVNAVWKPTLMLGAISVIWVLVSQSDKLFASWFMPGADFSHYQIAAQLAGVIGILAVPLIQYLMPRVNRLKAAGEAQACTRSFFQLFSLFLFVGWQAVISFYVNGDVLVGLWLFDAADIHGVTQYIKPLFVALFFAGIMQLVFVMIFAFNLLKLHLMVYLRYAVLAVSGSLWVALAQPEQLANWYMLHAAALALLWGGLLIRRFFRGYQVFALVYFGLLPLSLTCVEAVLRWSGLTDITWYYLSLRVFLLMVLVALFIKYNDRLVSRVLPRWV
jgi:O-antigen/teichoic acid export membrane protein